MTGGASWHVDAFVKALESKVAALDHTVAVVVADSAHDLESTVKRGFTQAHRKGTPTPAGKGQPPAVVTGTLRRSVKTDGPVRVGFGSYTAQVGPTVVYARRQELDPAYDHPYLKPAYERFLAARDLQRRLVSAVNGVLLR